MRHATSSNGWPSYHLEDVVLRSHAFQADLLSLVHEGAFAKFPRLRVVLLESGFTWLPNFMWRANKTWRGVRAEVPWVDRPPPTSSATTSASPSSPATPRPTQPRCGAFSIRSAATT